LIRSETDHGITVIVDARTDRRYFRRLRDAFPRDTRIQVIRRHQLPSILAEIQLGRESTG
jgi:Rad3-related DNA helicase